MRRGTTTNAKKSNNAKRINKKHKKYEYHEEEQ